MNVSWSARCLLRPFLRIVFHNIRANILCYRLYITIEKYFITTLYYSELNTEQTLGKHNSLIVLIWLTFTCIGKTRFMFVLTFMQILNILNAKCFLSIPYTLISCKMQTSIIKPEWNKLFYNSTLDNILIAEIAEWSVKKVL